MTREETLLVKEIIRKANTAILFLVEKNRCFPFPEEVQKYFSFTDKASDDLFVKMTVNKKYANSPTIEICLPLSGSWKIKRSTHSARFKVNNCFMPVDCIKKIELG